MPVFEPSYHLPEFHIICPNCNRGETMDRVYIGSTMKCLKCNKDFELEREHIIVIP